MYPRPTIKRLGVFYMLFVFFSLASILLLLLLPPQPRAVGTALSPQAKSIAYFVELASITTTTTTVAPTTTTTTLKKIQVKPGRPTPPADSPSYEPGSIEALIAKSFPSNPALWIAIAKCESGLNPNAYNAEGASGLYQIMLPLHADMLLPGENIYDPNVNIRIALSLSRNGTMTRDWNSSKGCWS